MPQSYVVDAVVAAVKELPDFPRLRVLDLSCGEAEILNHLKSLGCEVQGTHYRSDDYIVEDRKELANVPVVSGVDLHKPLPFEDASFQVVILSEVLEHLEWHGTVIREAGRILKPGGHLLFTTPNIFRLHSRLQFFLTGKHKLIRRRLGWDMNYDERYAYHITPVDFPLAHALLHQAGQTRQDRAAGDFLSLDLVELPDDFGPKSGRDGEISGRGKGFESLVDETRAPV